ncbi:unnamed protein product [Gordionus sp. m RMFG-2023]
MNINLLDFKKIRKYIFMEIFQKLYPFKKLVEKHISIKKLIILIFSILIFLLYVWPLFQHKQKYKSNICLNCLNDHLFLYHNTPYMNTIIQFMHLDDYNFTPFLGNGYIGIFLNDPNSKIHIRQNNFLSIAIDFEPIINIKLNGIFFQEAYVTSFLDGIVRNLKCIKYNSECVFFEKTFIVHRNIPSLLIQKFTINNPSDLSLEFDVESKKVESIFQQTKIDFQDQNLIPKTQSIFDPDLFEIFYGKTISTKISHEFGYKRNSPFFRFFAPSDLFLHANILILKPKTIKVAARSKTEAYIYIFMRYSLKLNASNKDDNNSINLQLDELIKNDVKIAFSENSEKIINEHILSWNNIWKSGFAISQSKSALALNGDKINSTFYHYLCHQPSNSDKNQELALSLTSTGTQSFFKDNCYSSHTTLLSSTLWSEMKSRNNILKTLYLWDLTLDKNGCYKLIQSGISGALQALIYSVGSFKITANHLEFSMDPKELHRDMVFRYINYKNSFLTIRVDIGDDNRALLYINTEPIEEQITLYACDAGCLDPLVIIKFYLNYTFTLYNQQLTALYSTVSSTTPPLPANPETPFRLFYDVRIYLL